MFKGKDRDFNIAATVFILANVIMFGIILFHAFVLNK